MASKYRYITYKIEIMKKTSFYLFSMLLLMGGLTSCLGDTKSSVEGNGAFAVIDIVDGNTKVANLAIGSTIMMLSSPDISSLDKGDVVLLNYKFDPNNYLNSLGVIKADYAAPTSNDNIFRNSDQISVITEKTDTLPAANKIFKSVGMPPIYSPYTYFLDKWMFSYSADVAKGQNIGLQLIYDNDPSKQVDNRGKALPENTYVIDLKLVISGGTNSNAQTITKENRTVVNFSSFRDLVRSPKDQNVSIWLRYYQNGDKDRPTYRLISNALLFEKKGA